MKARNLFLLLAGATLLVAGCNKQNPFGGKYSRKAGAPVVFGVGSGNMGTRTVYGEVDNTTHIQAINWLSTDEIRVYSPDATCASASGTNHWADYSVNPISGTENKGTLTAITNPGLSWVDAGNHTFYSVYPAPGAREVAEPQGTRGIFEFSMPTTQLVTDEMEYAFMTAAAAENAGVDGDAVELDFYPAFTAFEFTLKADQKLTLKNFTLSAADGNPALAGAFKVTYTGTTPAYTCTGTDMAVSIASMGNDAVIDVDAPFTFKVFCLPQALKGLKIKFTVRGEGWTADETRSLTLNKADGTPVEFAPRKIHKISGTMQGAYNFKYITLTGEAIEWGSETVTEDSDGLPQATQFAVLGADIKNVYELHNNDEGKALRQTWILGDNTATVSFKIFSPEGGSWEIVPQGDVDKFLVNGNVPDTMYGHINTRTEEATEGATKVTFTVSSNGASAGDQIWFKTYVYTGADRTGDKISLDSETQLYDLRGYHYFRIDDPLE